ncbi:MAG: carboxypeptidase-like regulatory domain-containing protein [Bacteroidia bacterium]|nr:carboxypeptidase-like regulatory domain-containing protein [Bacteroidia bacterium]
MLCSLLLYSGMAAQAQVVVVNGIVTDEASSQGLIGARVLVEGTTFGALTTEGGRFTLRVSQRLPFYLITSYLGYDTVRTEVTASGQNVRVALRERQVQIEGVEIVASAQIERQRQSPISVESMSINAIKETPAANFYDGLGALKGVDLTSASIGFKVINTRGFNAAAPVRSLQIIDGVDNQAPGLNFSLGNFLGASELDVQQVDLIVGASSAFYGPNAFNGVISMTTQSPFVHKGLSAMVRVGERDLGEFALRYAHVFRNKAGADKLGVKFNAYYLRVNDWEADNMDPVDGATEGIDNPGGYDAVNRYGDENLTGGINNATSLTDQFLNPGLGRWHRTGYRETDLVDYNTRNVKLSTALHYRLRPEVELIASSSFATGTTVLQGDNRYSLKDILFFQNRLELKKANKYFLRAYATHENAGNSYDAVFTAYQLQTGVKSDLEWSRDYRNYWTGGIPTSHPMYVRGGMRGRVRQFEGFPPQTFPFDYETARAVLAANQDSLIQFHARARQFADTYQYPYLQPGTPEFQEAFDRITSTPIYEGGTRLVDRSALYHVHGEHKFQPSWAEITAGANARLYTPVSEGNIFSDTLTFVRDTLPDGAVVKTDSLFKRITNFEYGAYVGIDKRLASNKVRLGATMRIDKNQNFNFIPSYAASALWNVDERHTLRVAISAAIRNPTLADQYLYYNVGRAKLLGNLEGFQNLADTASLRHYFESVPLNPDTIRYFDIAPIQPEKVQTIELGYRGSFFDDRVYIDASYYFSRYRDFIGYNIGVDVRFSALFPDQLIAAQAYRVAANATDIVTTQGVTVGVNYFFKKGYTFTGNYSWNVLNTDSDDPIIPAFNTPEHKFNLGFSGRDLKFGRLKHAGFSVNYKWIEGFIFEGSPQFTGRIPTYSLLDAQISQQVPKLHTTFKLGASNLLNNKVFQLYGGPRVGRLAYFTILTDLD